MMDTQESTTASTKSSTVSSIRHHTKPPNMDELHEKFKNLLEMYKLGIIDENEYEKRRKILIDKATGTSLKSVPSKKTNKLLSKTVTLKPQLPHKDLYGPLLYDDDFKVEKPAAGDAAVVEQAPRLSLPRNKSDDARKSAAATEVVDASDSVVTALPKSKTVVDESNDPWLNARPPPDFTNIACERAVKYTFEEGDWVALEVVVKIDPKFFARGSLRVAYHCLEICEFTSGMDLSAVQSANHGTNLVLKIAVDPSEDRETYFLDVWIQSYLTRKFADSYNSYKPPKKIDFVNAWVMKLLDRDCLCGVEPYIGREYRKHNNNFGYVSEIDRNTPQAFSHFSYVVSESKILICDIQGVNDMYTDPQIHSQEGGIYGKGDLGKDGINKFFSSHRCNAICRFFRLPAVNSNAFVQGGTVPAESNVEKLDSIWNEIHDGPELPTAILSETGVGPNTESDVLGLRPPKPKENSSLFKCCVIL